MNAEQLEMQLEAALSRAEKAEAEVEQLHERISMMTQDGDVKEADPKVLKDKNDLIRSLRKRNEHLARAYNRSLEQLRRKVPHDKILKDVFGRTQ